jgi:hypothetical protein
MSLLTGVSTSGYYVRTGQSPAIAQIAALMQDPAAPVSKL